MVPFPLATLAVSSDCFRLPLELEEAIEDAEDGLEESREGEIGLPPAILRGGLRENSALACGLSLAGLSALLLCGVSKSRRNMSHGMWGEKRERGERGREREREERESNSGGEEREKKERE